MGYRVTGKQALFNKLRSIRQDGERVIEQVIIRSTFYAQEVVIERITVLGLVDTGRLRSSWTVEFPGRFTGRVSTNVEYAAPLEYGVHKTFQVKQHIRQAHERKAKGGKKYKVKGHKVKAHKRTVDRKGYFYLRFTKEKTQVFLNQELIKAIRVLFGKEKP